MTDLVLVTVDSLRADHVGRYGYARDTTPTIDAVAADGHRFENAFAHACSTRPSFPSILTSSYPLMYGGFERIAPGRTLVSEPLADAGYANAGFHSNLFLSAEFGYDRGWETYFDSKTDPSVTARAKQAIKERLDENGRLYRFLAGAVDTAEREAGVNVGSAYVLADEITDRALQWVRSRAGADSRFLWVHYMDVHHPYVPPARHQQPFRDDPIGERDAIQLRRKMVEDPDDLTTTERDALVDLYDAEIRFADAEIGRLLSGIHEAWDGDPLTIVTADHGEAFGEHGPYSHPNTFYDEVMHVPLVASLPDGVDRAAGMGDGGDGSIVHDDLVGLLDVAPTLVDYAGGDRENFHGHSLRSLVEGGDWPRERVVGDHEGGGERTVAIRTTDRKFIRRESTGESTEGTVMAAGDDRPRGAGVHEELYDLGTDPGETTNVVAERPDERDRFREEAAEHLRAVAATDIDLGRVEMDDAAASRLRDLGYRE
ncbi:sulfatase [Halococcus agarilyticus]|uniref:sulfatase n=1 Tax=Halococcus agarilyticus TaxID=1232219 RepID=UPI0006783009|nr:sulfatase [Halococcus agarilyticus]